MMRRTAPFSVIGALVLLAGASGPAGADPTAGVDSVLVRPAYDSNGGLTLESGRPLIRHDFSFKLVLGYAQKPISAPIPGIGNDDGADPLLGFALEGDLALAFAFTSRLSFGLDAGFYRTDVDAGYGVRGRYSDAGPTRRSTGLLSLRPLSNLDPGGGFQAEQLAGPLDARIGLKYALLRGRKLAGAAIVSVSAPFGDEEMLLGDRSLVFEPRLAFDYALDATGTSKLMLNVGARIRRRTVLEAYDASMSSQTPADALAVLDVGSEALVGGGIVYELLPQLLVDLEAVYFQPLPEAFNWGKCKTFDGTPCFKLQDSDYFAGVSYGDPAAVALGGVSYRVTPDVTVALGGGLGLTGARKEDFRLMSGVIWQPSPAGSRVIGRGDSDGDGVPDAIDICVDEPEDKDGYQDDDGCPDLDNDGDGIIDASDGCPDEPEDKDGFEDDDGCPERDNDGDGVEDVVDRCPMDKEDKDGFDDEDGCPDEDNDGDGFPDDKDKCPNDPETVNGYQDDDGCPDSIAGGPQMEVGRIDLQGSKIAFTGNKGDVLTGASKTLLDQVADLIVNQGKGKIIRIESHVELSTKSTTKRALQLAAARDKDLTVRRARVVYDYLVGKGVSGAQLRQDALGSTRPIRQPATDPINDRIEFTVQ